MSGSKPGECAFLNRARKRGLVSAVANVIADDISLLEIENDQIMSLAIAAEGARGGRHRLLVG